MEEDDFDALYGSKYLSVADLKDREPTLKVGKVETAELHDKNGTTKRKYVMWFEKTAKALVLNQTNARKLADVYGKQPANWIGQSIQLYSEDTSFGRGVRVRPLRKPATPAEPDKDLNDAIPF